MAEHDEPDTTSIVVITRDLMDGGRFRSARPDIVVVRTVDDQRVTEADIVVLDLNLGIDPALVLAHCPRVVAYGAHVDTEALEAAAAAGCEDAVPRSKIFHRIATMH